MPRDKEVVLSLSVNSTQAVNSIQSFEKDMKAFSSLLSDTTSRSRALNKSFQNLTNIQRQYYETLSTITQVENRRDKVHSAEEQKIIDAENRLNKSLDTQASLELKLAKATEDRLRAQQQLDKAQGLDTPEAVAIKKEIEELTLLQNRLSEITQYRGKVKTNFLNDAAKYNLNAGQKRNEIEAELNRLLEERKAKLFELTNSFAVEQEIKKLELLVEELDKVGEYQKKQKTAFLGRAADLGYNIDTDMTREEVRTALISSITEQRAELLKLGEAVTIAQMKYDRLTKAEELARTKLEEQDQKVEEARNEYSQLNAELENTQKELENVYNQAQNENIDNLTNQAQSFNRELTQATGQAALDKISGTVRTIVSDFKKLVNTARKFVKTIGKLTGLSLATRQIKDNLFATNKINWSKAIRQIVQYGFGFRSLFFLVRRVRTQFVKAIKDLGTVIESVQEQLDSIKISAYQLRNALATALAPLLQSVTNLMANLASWAIRAANSIAQFFSVLTGQPWYRMSEDTNDYANALDNVSGSAKEAANSLAAFDDIDVLAKDTSGSGSGSSASEAIGNWMNGEDGISPFAEMIKKAWASDAILEAFEEVGKYIGEYFEKGLDGLLTNFWPNIQQKATKVAQAVAGVINGFFQTDAVDSFAQNIAQAINTAFSTLSNYWTNVDWGNLGTKIGNSIKTLIGTINWENISNYMVGKIKGILDFGANLIGDGSWITSAGEHLSELLQEILENTDFEKLGSTINTLITTVLDTLTNILKRNENLINENVDDFIKGLKIDSIITSLAGLFAEVAKLVITNGFKLLTSSGWFWGILSVWLVGEILKIGASTIIAKAVATKLGEAIVAGTTTVGAAGGAAMNSMTTLGTKLGQVAGVTAGVALFSTLALAERQTMINAGIKEEDDVATPAGRFFQLIYEKIKGPAKETGEKAGEEITSGITEEIENADLSAIINEYNSIFGEAQDSVDKLAPEITNSILAELMASEDSTTTSLQNMSDNVITTMNTVATNVVNGFNDAILPAYRDGFNEALTMRDDFLTKMGKNTGTYGGSISFANVQALVATSQALKLNKSNLKRRGRGLIAPLATGGVIPPNKPFLAMLGDQKKGTNIEAPLDTIVSAMQQALGGMNLVGVGGQDIVLNIDGSELARITVPNNLRELNRKGYNVKVLEKK